MNVTGRLPDCDGQAADAVSANTQVKLEDAPKLLKIPQIGMCMVTLWQDCYGKGSLRKSYCSTVGVAQSQNVQTNGYVLHDTKWPKSWANNEDPLVCLERNGLLWERQFEEGLLELGWEKVSLKLVEHDEPTSFLEHVYLGCTQRACKVNENIVQYREMFESRISATATGKLAGWEKPHATTVLWSYDMEGHARKVHWEVMCTGKKRRSNCAKFQAPCLNDHNFKKEELETVGDLSEVRRISSWSYDMEGHAKKCVERCCELANKTSQQLYKVYTPCVDDHHFKEEELKSVGELSIVCSQIVLKCLYLARICRPDILWSVNKLARWNTRRTKGSVTNA